ncbi:MAG: hypothetical protein ED557_14525 [Balneola sp.]|nr:MAG: hypothetical protein ED557_14525 [Balneola sp.]
MADVFDFTKEQTSSSFFVLDATLRDGGHLNQWKFSSEEVFGLVKGVIQAGVDAIEVGYISDPGKDSPTVTYCDTHFLDQIKTAIGNRNCAIVSMIHQQTNQEALIKERKDYLDLLRIPTTYDGLSQALWVASLAKKYNVRTSINLVNLSTLTKEQVEEVVTTIAKEDVADIFYLADSRGACSPNEVMLMTEIAKEYWEGLLGFHAHNNLGFAAINSQVALESGCHIIDGTLNGFGIGLGNLDLAHALTLIQPYNRSKKYNHKPIQDLQHFLSINFFAEWSYMYYLTGLKNMAPSWVKPLMEKFGKKCHEYVSYIPSKPYSNLDEVLTEIENYTFNQI